MIVSYSAERRAAMRGTGADLLVRYLEQEGVEYLFGVPGGHLLGLYDALYDAPSVRPILAKHEGGAAYMAAGYALAGRRLGVCCGTVGPGATNLISGVATAYMASLPVLALTAQVGTGSIGKGALQEAAGVGLRTASHTALFEAITKHSEMVTRVDRLPDAVERALRIAHTGRPGPVHLDLPADVLRGEIDADVRPVTDYRPPLRTVADPTAVETAAEALSSAKTPAILAGAGTRAQGAPAALRRLAEALNCPVATTLLGKGALPEDHPLSLGPMGLYGTRAANSYLRGSVDVLLVVGASLHEFTTHVWDPALQPSRTLIQIDVDPEQFGRNYPVDIALLGGAAAVLSQLVEGLETAGRPVARNRDVVATLKSRTGYFADPPMRDDAVPLKPQRVMAELQRVLPDDALVFTDIGNNLAWVERNLMAKRPDQIMSLAGLAAMGSGVAGVVGGRLAQPERPAVCICGDGGFQMHGFEVATAVNYDLPIVWVVLVNRLLGMIKDVQVTSYRGRVTSVEFDHPDFVQLAEALGAVGLQALAADEIAPAFEAALDAGAPAILSVPIDPQQMPPTKPRMLAMERSLGLPPTHRSLSLGALRALWGMWRER
jgi:acetolactate synthase-1/2/3 large subunit